MVRLFLVFTYIWEKDVAKIQAQRHGGAFRGRVPHITICAPQTRIVPPKQGLCPKESIRLGSTGVRYEACVPQNTGNHPRFRVQVLFFRRSYDTDLF